MRGEHRGAVAHAILVLLVLFLLPCRAAAQGTSPHDPAQPQPGEQREYPSLRLVGFADVDFSGTSRREGPRGFSLGQLALHLTSELSPRVTFFGEISFTARSVR